MRSRSVDQGTRPRSPARPLVLRALAALRVLGDNRASGEPRGPRMARERGSVTAEFAVVLPAVVVTLALCLGGLHLVTVQVQVADAASEAARALGRGESVAAAEALARRFGDVMIGVSHDGGIACVSARAGPSPMALGSWGLRPSARSCAWSGP